MGSEVGDLEGSFVGAGDGEVLGIIVGLCVGILVSFTKRIGQIVLAEFRTTYFHKKSLVCEVLDSVVVGIRWIQYND